MSVARSHVGQQFQIISNSTYHLQITVAFITLSKVHFHYGYHKYLLEIKIAQKKSKIVYLVPPQCDWVLHTTHNLGTILAQTLLY